MAEFDVLGETGGSKSVVLTLGQMPRHDHNPITNASPQGPLNGNVFGYGSSTDVLSRSNTMAVKGNDEAHPNLQPYVVTNYIISAGTGR